MKKWKQLNSDQQAKASEYFFGRWLKLVSSGHVKFSGSPEMDTLQEQIEKACLAAEAAQTPWFVHEYLCDDSVVTKALRDLASDDARKTLYMEPDEQTVSLEEINSIEL